MERTASILWEVKYPITVSIELFIFVKILFINCDLKLSWDFSNYKYSLYLWSKYINREIG